MRLMLGEISAQEEGILDKALIDTYATKGITMEVVDTSTFQTPTMADFHSVLSSMDGAADMTQRISKYVTGTYAGIFNKETNVTLDTGLMVFSVRDLEDELRPVAMYIILNYIWNRVRSSLKKRILVIDEAWSLMQHEDSAKFLFGLVKRARKYYLGVTTITQDVEDFVASPFGKPIITNSSLQLLLKQSPSAIEPLSKIFNLTEGEKYMLLNSGVGQGLFFAGLKHVAIQVIASFSEDKIVTTNPEELLAKSAVQADFETADAASDSGQAKPEGTKPAEVAPADVKPAEANVPAVPKEMDAATEEANFTENVAAVLDQPIEAPKSVLPPESAPVPVPVVATPAEEKPVEVKPAEDPKPVMEAKPAVEPTPAPAPVQDIPVIFEEKAAPTDVPKAA